MLIPITNPRFCFPTVKVSGIVTRRFPTVNSCFGGGSVLLPNPNFSRNFFFGLMRTSRRIKRHPATTFPDSRINVSAVIVVVTCHIGGGLYCFLTPFCMLLYYTAICVRTRCLISIVTN